MTEPMRAVCLREPWLYLMLDLPPELRKDVENRDRKLTNTLGPILVKSSARKGVKHGVDLDVQYYDEARATVAGWGWFPMELFPAFEQLQFGCMRGALNFAELFPPHFGRDLRWKFPLSYGYRVDRFVRFDPRPMKGGGQGIFYTTPTEAEAAALRAGGLLLEAA